MKNPTARNYNDLWAYLFLVYATAVILFPVVFTKGGSFFIKQDNLHQAYPFYNKLAIALHKGYLPVWDANTFGGKNFAGEMQTGIFYPVNILWCILFGSIRGIDTYHLDLLMALHYLICAIGMYKVGRVFQLSIPGAVATALIFTFSGAVGARAAGQTCIFCGLTLMPWSVFFIGKYYMGRRSRWNLMFAGLIAGLEILAGHIQPCFHTIVIETIIIVFLEYQDRKNWIGLFAPLAISLFIILLTAIIISLPQLYYASQYMARAYRTVSGGVFIESGQKVPLFIYGHWFIIELENLFNLFVQDYAQPSDDNTIYMGILTLILVYACLTWKGFSNEYASLKKWLSIILLFGLLSALGYMTLFYLILYEIPFVNQVRQLGRYIILISFSGSMLAGQAITQMADWACHFFGHNKGQKTVLLAIFAVNALYLALFQQKYVSVAVSIPFLLAAVFFLSVPFIKPSYLPVGAVAVILIDLILNPVAYQSTRTSFYPDYFYARNRIVDSLEKTYGHYRVNISMNNYNLVRRNLGAIYSIQTKWGYGATVNTAYAAFTKMDKATDPEIDDLLNVRYILSDTSLDSNAIFRDSIGAIRLYERKSWYPRCYWQRQLGRPGRDIEKENRDAIRQLVYWDDYQRWQVHSEVADTLIFSENYYPGWNCYDNGEKLASFPARIKNHPALFRAVVLAKGEHILEFKFCKAFYWF